MAVRANLGAVAVVLLVLCGAARADMEKSDRTRNDYSRLGPDIDKEKRDDPKRKKQVEKFFRQLGKMKRFESSRKNIEDYFLVGTAELNPVTRHADVCFKVHQGQRDVAQFVVDYMAEAEEQADAPVQLLRKWHVFSRFGESEQADQALEMLRTQYDELAAYRESIARRYNAKTVRRS